MSEKILVSGFNSKKKFLFILVIIILLCNCSVSQIQLWKHIQVNPINTITGIHFYDSLKGWYVTTGMNPDFGSTTNAGASWGYVSLGTSILTLNSICFVDDKTGWIAGSYNIIRKTTNGGVSWLIQDNPSQIYNSTIHFSDTLSGIVGGASTRASILSTNDGGENWNIVYSSMIPFSEVKCQYWLNHDTAWIAGYDILLKTTDCGNTFNDYYTYFPPSSNGSNAFLDIFFINENTGWVCGLNIDQKNLFITTNGGYNWQYQENPVQLEGYTRQINGIKFIDDNTGWAVSSALTIIKTTNRGINWNIDLVNNFGDEYYSVEKRLKHRLWVGSSNGKLWYRDSLNSVYIKNYSTHIPKSFKLYCNYPNPFNPSTTIEFSIPKESPVSIVVYDITGREVETLVNEVKRAGYYTVQFNASRLSSGIYFYRITAGDFIRTKKMVLIK